jgi:hypothetical protein
MTTRTRLLAAAGPLLGLALAACSDSRSHARAVAVLVDVSGTYTDKLPDVSRILRAGVLPGLRPGDTFLLVRIQEQSYQDDALAIHPVLLDVQPSRANHQKLTLAGDLDRLAGAQKPARFTDISGALLRAGEHLHKSQAGEKVLVIFSDMKEELPKQARRSLEATELAGVDVMAMNVKRLAADANDPAAYRARLDEWGKRLTAAGARSWTVVLEPEELARRFEQEP